MMRRKQTNVAEATQPSPLPAIVIPEEHRATLLQLVKEKHDEAAREVADIYRQSDDLSRQPFQHPAFREAKDTVLKECRDRIAAVQGRLDQWLELGRALGADVWEW